MKFRPVRIDEKPVMKTPMPGEDDERVREGRAVGRVERPARVNAARNERPERKQPAEDVDVPAQQIDSREREVFGPDHHGDEKVPEHGGDGRNQEEEDHQDAVLREDLVIGVRLEEVALRRQQLKPDEQRVDAAQEEEERDGPQVEQGDALVVLRQEPRLDAVLLVQVVDARRPNRLNRCC